MYNIKGAIGVKAAIEAIAESTGKISAIKLLRGKTGCSLATGKELVEYVIRTYPHTNDHWEKKE